MVKQFVAMVVILTGIICSANTVLADDFQRGVDAYQAENYSEAVKWFRKSAEQGHAFAQAMLAAMLSEGQGVLQDYKEAAKWYRMAAEQGQVDAQAMLGVSYANGQGVLQDYKEAMKWYRKAAEQGDEYAQFNLGVMYHKGQGVLQDMITAHMWFNIAAANGVKEAAKNRDTISERLSSIDLVKAQQQAKRCMSSGYKDCD